jgi:signal transduction histidine kinase
LKRLYSFGRDALLLDTLSIVAECQDHQTFWVNAMGRLKWILDFTRVDVALLNPDKRTYDLHTVFELRPNVPLISQTDLPVATGIIGKMLRSGEACHCFNPRIRPFAKECVVDESLEGGSLLSILSVRLEANHKLLGVLSFGSPKEGRYCHQDIEVATRFATHAAIAVQNWQHFKKLEEDALLLDLAAEKLRDSHAALESLVAQRTAALRRLSQWLMRTQDEERRRVARDLHDSTGQTLTALKLNIASLQKQFEKDRHTSDALAAIAAHADQALQEIRTTSYLLHPPLLDEAGLASAVRWYVNGFSQRSGINVNCDFPFDSARLPSEVEIVLFRVLQETLTNVHRHSGASIVDIELQQSSEAVIFKVQDNGRGIEPELLDRLRRPNSATSVGVAGMRERINELDGEFEMESCSNGTTFLVRIPLASTDQDSSLGSSAA